jgi:hypothetical protein
MDQILSRTGRGLKHKPIFVYASFCATLPIYAPMAQMGLSNPDLSNHDLFILPVVKPTNNGLNYFKTATYSL